MFNFSLLSIFALTTLLLVGCSTNRHERMKGSVAMKINESKGVACLFGEKPRVGDKLTLFQNLCSDTPKGKDGAGVNCKMVESGEASITKMMNDHYAEFETKQNVPFEEGYIIKLSK